MFPPVWPNLSRKCSSNSISISSCNLTWPWRLKRYPLHFLSGGVCCPSRYRVQKAEEQEISAWEVRRPTTGTSPGRTRRRIAPMWRWARCWRKAIPSRCMPRPAMQIRPRQWAAGGRSAASPAALGCWLCDRHMAWIPVPSWFPWRTGAWSVEPGRGNWCPKNYTGWPQRRRAPVWPPPAAAAQRSRRRGRAKPSGPPRCPPPQPWQRPRARAATMSTAGGSGSTVSDSELQRKVPQSFRTPSLPISPRAPSSLLGSRTGLSHAQRTAALCARARDQSGYTAAHVSHEGGSENNLNCGFRIQIAFQHNEFPVLVTFWIFYFYIFSKD